jgi:hypothetical protein
MSKLGKRLIKALKEARAIARGEADPATYRVHVPTAKDELFDKQLGDIRECLDAEFGE